MTVTDRLFPDPTYYPTPREAMRAPPEKVAYVACLYTGTGIKKPDFIAVIDVDPRSESYGKLISRVDLNIDDELHHFGWNACSSMLCPYGNPTIERRYLIVPGLRSSNIHVIDTKPNPRQPRLVKTIPGEKVRKVAGYSRLHTVHCGPDAIYLSGLGGAEGDEGPGGVFLLDHYSFNPLGRFEIKRGPQYLAYDFWWHLTEDVMITSEWTVPKYFENGPSLEALQKGLYGNKIHFWDLRKRRHLKELVLSDDDRMVLELRPFHNPSKTMGFVNVVVNRQDLSSSIWLWYKEDGQWNIQKVIEIEAKSLEKSELPDVLKPFGLVPPLVTDIHLSLDDKYLYVSCWGLGELRCYDVGNPFQPRLASTAKLGGIYHRSSHPNGTRLQGGPQMVEVSRDGRRVYVTNSLYSSWDPVFYPEGLRGWMVKLNSNEGVLTVDEKFFPDFGEAKSHQVRLEGGDSSSDSFCYPDN